MAGKIVIHEEWQPSSQEEAEKTVQMLHKAGLHESCDEPGLFGIAKIMDMLLVLSKQIRMLSEGKDG